MNHWTCTLCDDRFPADELSSHYRQVHPDLGILQWNSTPVVYEEKPHLFLHEIYKSYVWTLIRKKEWIGVLDSISHALHFPKPIRHPICNAWDRYLGVTDDEMGRQAPHGTPD
jgi:hypothetical protein